MTSLIVPVLIVSALFHEVFSVMIFGKLLNCFCSRDFLFSTMCMMQRGLCSNPAAVLLYSSTLLCSMLQLQRVEGINGTQPGESLTHGHVEILYGFRTYPVLSCPYSIYPTDTVLDNRRFEI